MEEILLFFALKYDGDFQSILKALQRKEKVTNQQREEAVSKLQLNNQMDIVGGAVGTWIVCIVVGAAVYKMLYSKSGRISIPRLVSIEWR